MLRVFTEGNRTRRGSISRERLIIAVTSVVTMKNSRALRDDFRTFLAFRMPTWLREMAADLSLRSDRRTVIERSAHDFQFRVLIVHRGF